MVDLSEYVYKNAAFEVKYSTPINPISIEKKIGLFRLMEKQYLLFLLNFKSEESCCVSTSSCA